MKLGFLSAPFPGTPLAEVADWAAANGFSMLEVCCWPRSKGPARRYAGICHIDVDGLSEAQAKEVVEDLAQRGVGISGLAYYPNPLHPDPDHRAEAKKVWPDIVAHAADSGVKIAIENCPMIFSSDEWPSGHNLAYSPAIWRTVFDELGENVGLNFDPSHLVWQMIDLQSAIDEFGERFYHVHAKDLEIDAKGLYDHGIMSLGMGWQVPRLPGLGEVDWRVFFSSLYRVGYDYVISIEHEDRRFESTDELVKRGFLLARDVLTPYIK